MKLKKIKFVLFCLFFLIGNANSQSDNLSSVSGNILDKISKSPIVGATVVLKYDSLIYFAKSDSLGRYQIKQLLPNIRYEIMVDIMGYKRVQIPNILVSSGKEEVLDIEMEEKVRSLQNIIIKGKKREVQNEMSTVSARSFSMEEVNRYSGGRGDPARLAANFAGVSAPNDQRNDLVIRGNSPQGVLWKFEGINVPNLNHFSTLSTTGGPVSALNTNVLKNSDFMTSAFPSEYGNALAGVFDLGMRRGNTNRHEYTFQVSAFTGMEAMAEGPLNKGKGSSYLVAGRYSFAGLAKVVGLNIGTAATPYYQDITFKINSDKGKWGQLSFFGLGAMSHINFLHNEIDSTDIFANPNEDSYVKSRIGVLGLSHTVSLNPKSNLKTVVGVTYTANSFHADSVSHQDESVYGMMDVNNNELHYVFNSTISSKINSNFSIKAGIINELYQLFLCTQTHRMRPDWETTMNFSDLTNLSQSFVQGKYNFDNHWSMVAGVHTQFLSLNNSFAIEPRFSVKYLHNNIGSFSFGYGMHHQMKPLAIYFYQELGPNGSLNTSNRNLGYSRSQHFVFGHEYWIKNEWKIKTEVYAQFLDCIGVDDTASSFSLINEGAKFASTQRTNLVNEGFGRNMGIELTIEKYFTKGYYALITGSLYDAKYKGSDGIERNTAFNGHYVLNILAGKEFSLGTKNRNAFTFDTKFTIAGGRYYTPIDINVSRMKMEEITMGDQFAMSQMYPDYMRWDVKFGYRMNGKNKKISQMLFLDFQNITFRQNIFALRFNTVTKNVNTSYQNGFFPNFTYKIQF